MTSQYVTFSVKPEELQTVLEIIKTFLTDVAANESETVYEAYRVDDQFDFLHLMHFSDEAAMERHGRAPYTARFVEALYPRCQSEPQFKDITPV